jgi:nucleoside-diphosphate-sugar epimerase
MKVLLISGEGRLMRAVRQENSRVEWTTLEPGLLTDDDAVGQAVQGVDAILHLGAITHDASVEESGRLDLDTRGLYVLLGAAVEAGVRRVVYGSRLDLFASYPNDVYITEHWRPMPTDDPDQMMPYLGEMVCREYARDHRIGVTCLRIGALVDSEGEKGRDPSNDWVDYRDAAQAFHRALERDESQAINWMRRWAIYHIVSDHENPRFLLDQARIVGRAPLGYEPAFHFGPSLSENSDNAESSSASAAVGAGRPKHVLLLGAFGAIAPHITPELSRHYDLKLTDINPGAEGANVSTVDVTAYDEVLEASRGMDAIMNWTVIRQERDGAFFVNVVGAWNVMRAAVELGIRKVVHTGPQCIRSHYDHDFGVEDVPRAPGTWQYGLTKMLSYEICRIYARRYGIQTVCYVFNGLQPKPEGEQSEKDFPPMTIVYDDLAHACQLALDIESVPDNYQEFNMLSYEGHGKYNVDKARRILGFEPLEKWEGYFKRKADPNVKM